MRLRFTRDALTHLDSIYTFLNERNPAAARRIVADVRAAAGRLCEFPQIGRLGDVSGTREWVVLNSPYLIVYEIAGDEIVVLGIFHGAQDRRPSE